MKACAPAIIVFLAAAVVIAGCTSTSPSQPVSTLTPLPTPSATTTITQQKPMFELQNYYINRNYSFQDPTEVQSEQFRIPGDQTTGKQPWGIIFHVTPLNDNPQNCWFEMKVTNVDSGQVEFYGYGMKPASAGGDNTTYGYDIDHYIPMYSIGPYKIEMSGNRVSIRLVVGNRNP